MQPFTWGGAGMVRASRSRKRNTRPSTRDMWRLPSLLIQVLLRRLWKNCNIQILGWMWTHRSRSTTEAKQALRQVCITEDLEVRRNPADVCLKSSSLRCSPLILYIYGRWAYTVCQITEFAMWLHILRDSAIGKPHLLCCVHPALSALTHRHRSQQLQWYKC